MGPLVIHEVETIAVLFSSSRDYPSYAMWSAAIADRVIGTVIVMPLAGVRHARARTRPKRAASNSDRSNQEGWPSARVVAAQMALPVSEAARGKCLGPLRNAKQPPDWVWAVSEASNV